MTTPTVDDATLDALSKVIPADDLRKMVAHAPQVRKAVDAYELVMQFSIASAAGGRGALYTIEKAIKAMCFEAHLLQTYVIDQAMWVRAFQRLGGGADAWESTEELTGYLSDSKVPIFTILEPAAAPLEGADDLIKPKPTM